MLCVVWSLVVTLNFSLTVHRQHVGRIHTVLLVERRLRRGNLGGLTAAQTFGDVEHDILQAAAGPYHHVFQVGGAVLVLRDAETGLSTCRCPSYEEAAPSSLTVPVIVPSAGSLTYGSTTKDPSRAPAASRSWLLQWGFVRFHFFH